MPVQNTSHFSLSNYPDQDEFDDEWLCPYCARLTTPQAETCPHCRNPLISRIRVRPNRSVWLWRGFFLQLYTAFYTLAFTLGYYALIATLRDIPQPLSFWPVYVGLSIEKPASDIAAVLTILPMWAFRAAIGVALYALVIMALLYLRIPYAHLLYLINSGFTLIIGLIGILFPDSGWVQFGGVLGLLLGLFQLLITLNLWKDFSFTEKRLKLKVDTDAKEAAGFYLAAKKYSHAGMWGSATLHLRRAVAKNPGNPAYHIALCVTYINLKRADLAEKTLCTIAELDSEAPELKPLRARLAKIKPN